MGAECDGAHAALPALLVSPWVSLVAGASIQGASGIPAAVVGCHALLAHALHRLTAVQEAESV